MVKNAKRICVAICFGSSNNLTGLLMGKNLQQMAKLTGSFLKEFDPRGLTAPVPVLYRCIYMTIIFKTFPLKPLSQSKPKFIWSLLL